MHNLTKIRIFRIACWITYPLALIFVYPLVFLRKRNGTHLFFFFDRYAIGGAQRIHLDILESVKDYPKLVYFTRKSTNAALKEAFYTAPNTTCLDVHFWCDNLVLRLFTVHFFAFYINRHKKAVLLSANSTFFYDMLPFLNKRAVTIELLHMFTHGKKGMEFFGLANHKLLKYRFIYDTYTLQNIKKQYQEYNVPDHYLDRIVFIEPGVEVGHYQGKSSVPPLKVLYAGRGGLQKRIHLLNQIAENLITNNWPVEFHFAGTMMEELSELVKDNSVLHGEISRKEAMDELYHSCHAIIMTSAYEGFPMLIKEGMAFGCIPIVTALDGNLMHLRHQENSLLINAVEDEDKVVAFGLENIRALVNNPKMVETLSHNAFQYAKQNFDKSVFLQKCRALLVN